MSGFAIFLTLIFVFNITRMIEYINAHPSEIVPEEVAVSDFPRYSPINDSQLESVTIGRPVILAEISPGKYNLIDGNHRMEKARKMGMQSISAYRLRANQRADRGNFKSGNAAGAYRNIYFCRYDQGRGRTPRDT